MAGLGYGQELTICDAGLPIPGGLRRIDLALEEGLVPFLDTIRVVIKEMKVEYAVVAR